jgi:hypothetical protein
MEDFHQDDGKYCCKSCSRKGAEMETGVVNATEIEILLPTSSDSEFGITSPQQ